MPWTQLCQGKYLPGVRARVFACVSRCKGLAEVALTLARPRYFLVHQSVTATENFLPLGHFVLLRALTT